MHKEKAVLIEQVAEGVAHEVRNPLTSIIGLLVILKEKIQCDNEIKQIIDIVNSEAGQLNSVVNTLVSIARPVPPKLKLERIEPLLNEVIAEFKTRADLNEGRCVYYTVNKEEGFPEWLFVDYSQLKKVITDVTLNAVQSITGKGKITFNMYYYFTDNKVKLEIADTGCGIPEKDLPKVGLPFFTTIPSGKGLSLSSSIMIINRHGGRLEIDSEVGKGTVVSIYLPV